MFGLKSLVRIVPLSVCLLAFICKAYAQNEKTASVTHSILIIEGKNGAGTGFISTLGDKKYIFTNAHVFLDVKDPKIVDISNTEYTIVKAFAHKSEDIAIIQVADFKSLEPLKIYDGVENIAIGTKTVVFGNSLGAEVVTKIDGSVEGIGPEKVEVNNAFVSGNSGSPICLSSDSSIIGIATFVMKISDTSNISLEGSRFDSKKITAVRRFGLRIDNLKESDFEEINLETYQKDIAELDNLKSINESILDWLKHLPKDASGNSIRLYVTRKYASFAPSKNYDWNSAFMKNEYKEQCKMKDTLVKALKLKDEVAMYQSVAKISKGVSKDVKENILSYIWGMEPERAEKYAKVIAKLPSEKQEKISSGLLDMRRMHAQISEMDNKKRKSNKVKSLYYSVDQLYKELFGAAASEWYENEAKLTALGVKMTEMKNRVAEAKKAVASALIKNKKKEQAVLSAASAALKEYVSTAKPYVNKRNELLESMRACEKDTPNEEKPEYVRDALAGKPTKL